MVLDRLQAPIVLAPLAGGPSTPELAAAVSGAGGLGFLAAGYLSAEETRRRIGLVRAARERPFGVNLFVPPAAPADPAVYGPFAARLRAWASARGLEPGEPRFSDDDWEPKLELLLEEPVAVVSFVFGCPGAEVLAALARRGTETWVTVTAADEARAARDAGADVLVVQGAEAGGHRGSFEDRDDRPPVSLLPLLQATRAAVEAPLVAAGGIATAAGVAAVIGAGARAAQVGTAFMLAPEAGTDDAHRAAIASGTPTALTRSFTGRLARGIRNAFMAELPDAPSAYPEIHYMTAPLRAAARRAGDADGFNLWAGEAHALARARPAAETVAALTPEPLSRAA